jgi:hypothetical protein
VTMDEQISLRGALAWIFARNLKFNEVVEADFTDPIEAAYKRFNESNNRRYLPVISTVHDAWSNLQDHLRFGRLGIAGVAHRRSVGDQGIQWKPISRPSPDCPKGELDERPGVCRLIGQDSAATPIRWETVTLNRSVLWELFPSVPLAYVLAEGTETTHSRLVKLTKKEQLVAKIVSEVWPNIEAALLPETVQVEGILGWLTNNLKRPGGEAITVSPKTIARYFEKVRQPKND